MRPRLAVALWLVVGAAVWNGFFDLYILGGMQEYVLRQAEFELGRAAEPSMSQIMARAQRLGVTAASLWTAVVVAAAWATFALATRGRPRQAVPVPTAGVAGAGRVSD